MKNCLFAILSKNLKQKMTEWILWEKIVRFISNIRSIFPGTSWIWHEIFFASFKWKKKFKSKNDRINFMRENIKIYI